MQEKLQFLILKQLTCDLEFTKTVIQYLKPEYFEQHLAPVFKLCYNYNFTYNTCPNTDALECELDSLLLPQEIYDKSKKIIASIRDANAKNPKIDTQWMIKQTEDFCKKSAYYAASIKVVEALDDDEKQGEAIKEIEEASAFSFDINLGLDYRKSFSDRYELYTHEGKRIPFGIKELDKITNGGVFGKTLNLLVGPTGHGKSLIMASMMAENMRNGLNVACYTFEMGDYRIAERIDANLLNISINDWKVVGKDKYMSKASEMLDKVKGNIYIKEYASGSANSRHIKKNLEDLKTKFGFIPDIVYVDYVNIVGSYQLKSQAKQDTYIYMTVVAEELRRVAQELDIPIISACQTNRGGENNMEMSVKDVGDSHGISKTADLLIGFTRIENDETMKNKLFFRQIKNRYNDISYYNKFLIGVDYPKMRIHEVEPEIQEAMLESEEQKEEDVRILRKEVGSLTIDDWQSGKKYKSDMFSDIKF